MGTTYKILEHAVDVTRERYNIPDKGHVVGTPAVCIELDEHSNVFDLSVHSALLRAKLRPEHTEGLDASATVDIAYNLTFADLRAMRDRINEILGYFDEVTS